MEIIMDSIRKPAVAGTFYPDEPGELKEMVEKFLDEAEEKKIPGKLRALISPHAGYVYSGPVAAYAYKLLQKEKFSKIILLGPTHFAAFFGAAQSGVDGWQTPLGIVECGLLKLDTELFSTLQEVHAPEHSLEVQIPFLQVVMKNDFTIYPILIGDANHEKIAEALLDQIDDKTLIIASSDLSHYNPYEKAIKLDSLCNKVIPALDIDTMKESGDACGKSPILVLMHIAKKKGWGATLLDYRNSGDTAGSRDAVVGYGAYAFYEE
jgi:AmmeMemoRadiSam system protein B